MKFIKYDSIENIDNTKLVEKAFFEGKTSPGIPWIAQEIYSKRNTRIH